MIISIIVTVAFSIGEAIFGYLWYTNRSKKCTTYKRFTFALGLVLVLIVPFLINELYKNGGGYETIWGAEEVLSFYGSFLAFIGTVVLGTIAVWQTKKANSINAKLLRLDDTKKKESLFEQYYSFMEEANNIFNPQYVIGDFEENRTAVAIFFAIKSCKIRALNIKRRLIFLDEANSDNPFLEYAISKIEEASQLAIKYKGEPCPPKELVHLLFVFMQDNSGEFNEKSFEFIAGIRKAIFEEET